MNDVTDLSQYRKRMKDRKEYVTPDVMLYLWFDPKKEYIECSSLHALTHVSIETREERQFIVSALMLGASRTAAMLAEDDAPDAWSTEPVFYILATRGGWSVTKPHRFWHDEAQEGFRWRWRCACWSARMAIKSCWNVLTFCWAMAFNPKKLRSLDMENG